MGLFDFVKEVATEVAMDTVRDVVSQSKRTNTVTQHKQAIENIDGTMVSLSPQGALLLACTIMMGAGIEEGSRTREEHRVYSVDRKNGFSIDLKEAIAVTRINFNSIEEAFEYWTNLIKYTLVSEDEQLTVITNMIDIAMVDGDIDDEEWARIGIFTEELEIDNNILKQIFAVIQIKNSQLSAKQG